MRWILSLTLGFGPVACVSKVQYPSFPSDESDFVAQVDQAVQVLGLHPTTDLDHAHLAMWDGSTPSVTCLTFADWATAKLAARAPEPRRLRTPQSPPRRRQDATRRRPLGLDQPQLTTQDRISLRLVQTALDSSDIRQSLFYARDLDLADRSTEWGGTLDWGDDGWFIEAAPGQSEVDDTVFERRPSDFRKMFHGAIPFHFHARNLNMSAVAGPGGTDLQAAESHGVPALVITSLSEDRLQVDWYRRGGVVVDLGEVER
ncbi:MAG: hypothetical protein VX109_05535 [Planctomycetota bacterium]|nr:hypothetical protein [Planctomycetota bacterium]